MLARGPGMVCSGGPLVGKLDIKQALAVWCETCRGIPGGTELKQEQIRWSHSAPYKGTLMSHLS